MVKKTPKAENNEIRDNVIHIAFTIEEKEQIRNYAKESNTTISEFIRQSVFDKILRIENPSKFGNVSSFEDQFKEIKELQLKQIKLEELSFERIKNLNGVKESLKELAPLVNEQELKKHANTIISLLKTHKSLSIDKIELLLNLDKDMIIQACSLISSKVDLTNNREVILK